MKRSTGFQVLLVLVAVFAVSFAAVAAPAYLNETGMPIVNQPLKLQMIVGQAAGQGDFEDLLVFQEYEKLSGIDVEWTMIPTTVLSEKRNLMLTAGEYPGAFHSARFNAQDLMMYGEQGIFIPLNDLIDQYAPNFKQLLDENPDLKRGLTMPDGNIYSFPRIFDTDFTSVLAGWKLWINGAFLETLGMDEPETLDEFYTYLKAVKEKDPNGNGIADEIPLGASGESGIIYLMHNIRGSFGLGNRGYMHEYVDIKPGTNDLRFIPTSDQYKDMLQFISKLYAEGLLQQDVYTVKSAETTARGLDGVFGAALTTNPITGWEREEYIGATALTGPYGDKMYSNVKSALVDIGAFVITDKNKHPEATVRWIDYFYGDEGVKLFFMGIEGITFEVMPDGSVEYSDLINNNPEGLRFTEAVTKYIPYRNGAYPSIVKEAYFKGSEGHPTSIAAADKVAPYFPETIWSPFSYTNDEMEIMSSIGSDIGTYVKEMRAKFITGQASFNDWNKYVQTLERMGLKQYMKVYQQAYDRYSK